MFIVIVVTALLITLMSYLASYFKLLTFGGAIAAAVVGLTTLFVGGQPAVGLLFLFFCTSNALGLWRKQSKQSLGFEKGGSRDQWQVVANGGPAVLGLILGKYCTHAHLSHSSYLALFAVGLAEAAADTWATEIGSATGHQPRSIISGKKVDRGASGGVTAPGTVASAAGSLFMALAFSLLAPSRPAAHVILIVSVVGFCGALIDSVLGASIQAQFEDESGRSVESTAKVGRKIRGAAWFRNDAVNFTAGLIAVLIALPILWQR